MKRQYEFHYFDAGFEKDDLKSILKDNKDSLSQNNFSYWSLLSSLDQQVHASLPLYLFTTNNLKRFSGKRPQVALNLQWFTYTATDSVSEWLAKVYMTTADSIRLVAATSKPSGTSYLYKNASLASRETHEYNIQKSNDNLSVSYKDKQQVIIDTGILHIAIFADKYVNDAAYVKAAFEAIQQYSKRKLKLSFIHNTAEMPQQQDWVFWLSDQPVPVIDARNIFQYEKGNAEVLGTSIQTENKNNDEGHVSLYKRITYRPYPGGFFKTVWQDGFGNPVLEVEKNKVPIYHFYSRFDPSWTDWSWSHAFPQMIFNLIWNGPNDISVSDNRIMDEQQLQPNFTETTKAVVKRKFVTTYDLSRFFWIAAFIAFLIERFISFRIKMGKTNA